MSDDDLIKQLNMEVEAMSFNELTELGNQAQSLELIIGHGYHKGQYEILRRDGVIILSPKEASTYLKNLIDQVNNQ